MIPILFEIGPIKIYSFGLMMGLAFIVGNFLLVREFRRKGMPPEKAGTITLIALVAGVVGSKLFSVFENWNQFIADPSGELFSAAGLTFYGGLILAIVSIMLYVGKQKLGFLRVADAASPSLILAYGIGRIGCQLAGDGDYGIPTDAPWAMSYPNGTVSTLAEENEQLVALWEHIFPDRPVPVDIPVHPTPIYETLSAIVIFAFLWKLRTRPMAAGMLFSIYLLLAGLERFLVEFIRLNPEYGTLSQAQWISIGMILIGGMMAYKLKDKAVNEKRSGNSQLIIEN
ncbi:MAG: prolipoprotein diacylglyceryl transferase [Chlorobi bacterium]|nr:prolipoprotein diacylglyceryl transferase [Chlorobiota bacterium]